MGNHQNPAHIETNPEEELSLIPGLFTPEEIDEFEQKKKQITRNEFYSIEFNDDKHMQKEHNTDSKSVKGFTKI